MNGRFFLDTNIFVYSLDRTAPAKSLRARELIREAIEKRQGIVSYQVVQEFFNVAFHRFAQPMSLADSEQYLATTFRPLLAVHSSQALLAEAMRLKDRFQLPWYDALIVASALEGECATLYSEDFQHGQKYREMRVTNPFL
jgi:predicted nucleic acid-binding protein